MDFLKTEKGKGLLLGGVFLLSVFLIVFHFTDTPRVWVDEGVFTEVAKNLSVHGIFGIQTAPGNFFLMNSLLTTGYPVIVPIALSFKIFGVGIVQARLPMLVYMGLLVFSTYLFTRKRYGYWPALTAVLLLISFSPFYGNGRPVQGEVPGLAYLVLGCWLVLLWEGSDFTRKKWAAAAGFMFGLSAATKPIYLILLSVVLVATLLFWFKKVSARRQLFIFASSFLFPLFVQIFIQFPSREAFLTIVPTYVHLAGNHESSGPVFQTILQNGKRFFTESTPVLFLVLYVSVVTSLFFRFKKGGVLNVSAAEFILVAFIALNVFAYLPGTGWYRYFFPANVLVYLLFPGVLSYLMQWIHGSRARKAVIAVPVLLILFQCIHLAVLSDTSFTVKRTRNSELAASLSTIPSTQTVLFYNTIEATVFYQGSNYSQYVSMGDFLQAGDKDALRGAREDVILTNADPEEVDDPLSCYERTSVSRYYLFERKESCR